MAKSLSDRDCAIAAYREAGHSLRQTAIEFNLSPWTVDRISRKVKRVLQATDKLLNDPGDLQAMAQSGILTPRLQAALGREGIRHVDDLRHVTLRHLNLLENVGPKGRQEIVELAQQWGIELSQK